MRTPGLVSIVIPSRSEIFLRKTILDLLSKARGDIEIFPILDGYWPPAEEMIADDRVNYVHRGEPLGLRAATNAGAALARGEYLMKTDAHCMFEEGFDLKLKADHQSNWVQIPRRYRLDAENWCWTDDPKPPIDLHYLACPMTNPDGYQMHGDKWPLRDKELLHEEISDTMSFQGSMWFMTADFFHNFLHGMQERGYGTFCQEPQEIGNKTWLGGGEVKVNKKVWYAHLHKGKRYGRGYFQSATDLIQGHTWSAHHWMNNREPGMIHKFEWLVEKFWPVPTWPDNWKELVPKYEEL